ncbi:MAG TPA: prolyl oligopeptidase family serine peptidase [Planctomycetota bacterium]|nr:prolyl oligopeptidase family serine peptidase [Planctomycetota bacterium]HRR81034.1 prolyl oligopeptidase family serine peptidase [Planctomycetota bacterium]HRT93634.1 prolyl oligopeptidase family serine peptidase [Planctomycetota bacterium]
MRWLPPVVLVASLASPAAAAEFAPGRETTLDFGTPAFKSTRGPLELPVFVPTDYTPTKLFPLVLFFHGRGGKPDTGLMQSITDRKGYLIVGMEYLQEDQAFFNDIETQLAFNHHVIKTLSARVRVNPRQIFIGGFSQGGFATALFGFRSSEVSTYRGYLMMAGGLGAARDLNCMRREPVLVIHGDKDDVVPYDSGVQAADALRKAGASVTFITMKGVGHTFDRQYAPEVAAWLRKQSEDERLVALMRRAKAAETKDMPLAIRTYRQIVDSEAADPLVDEAEKRLAEIDQQAAEALASAVEAIQAKRYPEAERKLQGICRAYEGTKTAAEAAAKLRELRADPEVARAAREAADKARADEAAQLLAKAKALLLAKDYLAAARAFDSLASGYEGTPSAAEARTQADALRNDPTLGPKLREAAAAEDCRRWMTMARNYLNSSRPEGAAPYLQKIIETYPNTSYAAEAKALLPSAR